MTRKKVVIVGQGYVGLPIAMTAVKAGFSVVGLDVDESRIASLATGVSYVEDVGNADLADALASSYYVPSTDITLYEGFDYVVITVPTPLRESLPDLSYIEDAARAISPYVTPGSTVILESTTYPGTTEELLVPILEEGSGLTAGRDFFVGYSPERIDPGNKRFGFVNTPKVAAGIDEASTDAVVGFYSRLVDRVVQVSSTKEAELTKLLENTFRHVNIALVNELAVFADALDIDVWEAIEAASTKPFGFMAFTPGPGVGGHCLPIDPSYLSWQVRRTLGKSFRFVELANDVNDHMPDYVVQRVAEGLNQAKKSINGSHIIALGLSYKRNTGDPRESPSVRVVEQLLARGGNVTAIDPHVESHLVPAVRVQADASIDLLHSADAIIILTDHDEFDYGAVSHAPGYVLDTRNRLRGARDTL